MCARVHAFMPVCVHACMCVRARVRACMSMCVCACLHACMRVCVSCCYEYLCICVKPCAFHCMNAVQYVCRVIISNDLLLINADMYVFWCVFFLLHYVTLHMYLSFGLAGFYHYGADRELRQQMADLRVFTTLMTPLDNDKLIEALLCMFFVYLLAYLLEFCFCCLRVHLLSVCVCIYAWCYVHACMIACVCLLICSVLHL